MIFGVASLLNMTVLDASGVMINVAVLPKHEVLFTVARYAFGLLLGLGLVVLLTGAFWKRAENRKKLAITQIIAGALIVAVSVFILRWGYTLEFIVPIGGGHLLQSVSINPALDMAHAVWLTVLTGLLGVAVIGVGIAQLVKARK